MAPLDFRPAGGSPFDFTPYKPSRFESRITTKDVYIVAELPLYTGCTGPVGVTWTRHEIAWTMKRCKEEGIPSPIMDSWSTLPHVHIPRDGLELFMQFLSTVNSVWQDCCKEISHLVGSTVRHQPLPPWPPPQGKETLESSCDFLADMHYILLTI